PYSGDSTGVARQCTRNFVLKVYLDAGMMTGYQAMGEAVFVLRPDSTGVWHIWLWFDESNV
ncbi:hypothetical protein JW921_09700, partial [Candidatus Fermentibacterales bacterium]|nr:hypothetical protein [Candidatus Fermentibacterales bacterium]